jgi:hypothetical protein
MVQHRYQTKSDATLKAATRNLHNLPPLLDLAPLLVATQQQQQQQQRGGETRRAAAAVVCGGVVP